MVLAGTGGIPTGSGELIIVTFDVNADAVLGGCEMTLTQAVFYDEHAQEMPLGSNTPGTFTTAIENRSWGQIKVPFAK